jgi:hypothetical protein
MSLLRLQYRDVSRAGVGLLFALLFTFAPVATLHAQQPGTAIIVYTQPQVNEQLWPDLLASLRADVAGGMGESPNDFALEQNPTYLRGNNLPAGIDFSHVIVVKLLGRCDVLPQLDRQSLKGPLGWVLRISGKIQPFIFVDCTRIAQVLRSTSPGLDKDERRHEMAQAIAHVVIHEWIHIATQSPAHGAHGITKQFLSAKELTEEPTIPSSGHLTASVEDND